MSAAEHEARVVLEHFTGAKDGAMVMEGDGVIFTFQGGWWVGMVGRRRMQVTPVVLARALNPDLAELIERLS